MRVPFVLSIISLIILSGCTAQVAKTESVPSEQPASEAEKTIETLPRPQITSTEGTIQETRITTGTDVEVTETPEEPTPPPEPRTFQVNIAQGIGIEEGSG
ncbi:MAG: hypothetical protein HYT11_04035 [Candidatus Levybacteria bacterium]|nr:hypothetical protein [Candidatus Levybacteria bacterium]